MLPHWLESRSKSLMNKFRFTITRYANWCVGLLFGAAFVALAAGQPEYLLFAAVVGGAVLLFAAFVGNRE